MARVCAEQHARKAGDQRVVVVRHVHMGREVSVRHVTSKHIPTPVDA